MASAIVFSVILQVTLISSWIWPEWIDSTWRSAGWWVVSLWWTVALVWNAWWLNEEIEPTPSKDAEALFREAQAFYLLGDWFRTESLLLQLLEASPGDAEARLLLATVYRRRDRLVDALQQLQQLEHLNRGEAWSYEIAAERRLIADSASSDAADAGCPATDEDRGSAEDDEAASLRLADGGKKTASVDEPTRQRRAA